MQRTEIADAIFARLERALGQLSTFYRQQRAPHFIVDDLLPRELAERIHAAFPAPKDMMLRRSIREQKFVTSQMNRCNALAEEAVFAFQDPRVVELIGWITGMKQLEPDPRLYAGGLSLMQRGHYLSPHIDNSHDKERKRYRVLNLLFYVTPNWNIESGGHLELWPEGVKGAPLVIESRFNRLVVMATTRASWHSVNAVQIPGARCCVSNYYFSPLSPEREDYFHVTSFRGRPDQPIRAIVLSADSFLRNAARRVVRSGIFKTTHYYQR